MLLLILVVVLICLLFYHTIEDLYLLYIHGVPPGPISLPLIGGLYKLDPYRPHVKLHKMTKEYGEIISIRFGPSTTRAIFIHNSKLVEKVCNNIDALDRPQIPYFSLITPDGAGIGSRPYDKLWMLHTRLIKSALSKVCQNTLSYKVNETLEELFNRFSGHDQQPQDVSSDIQLTSLRIISSVCYGMQYTEWFDGNILQLLKDHTSAMAGLSPFHPINICPLIKYLPISLVNNIRDITKRRDKLHQKLFDRHKENYTGEVHDIMDIIVEVMENGHTIKDSQKKQDELKNFFMSFTCLFMAGLDNLHFSMMWALLILGRTPNVREKIYQELNKTVAMDTMITTDAKKHLPYTEACVYEILRISSLTALSVPHCNRAEIKVDGYTIPKGSQIFTNIWHIHHCEKHWTDSHSVKPERFISENGQLKTKQDPIYQNYLPFGLGKRICTGAALINDVMFLFISNLVRTHNFTISKPVDELVGNASMCHHNPDFKLIFT